MSTSRPLLLWRLWSFWSILSIINVRRENGSRLPFSKHSQDPSSSTFTVLVWWPLQSRYNRKQKQIVSWKLRHLRQSQNLRIFFTLMSLAFVFTLNYWVIEWRLPPQALSKLKTNARLQNSDSKMTQIEPFRPTIQSLAETQRTRTQENISHAINKLIYKMRNAFHQYVNAPRTPSILLGRFVLNSRSRTQYVAPTVWLAPRLTVQVH